jgi:BirA family biotin operon repressor/biotin-[acetyl-CoA-carboxylase] ligase
MNLLRPKIRRYESLPSTNNEVARLAALGAEEGLAVVAEEQTAGRGRLQRTWISPKGAGLYFSILLRPKSRISLAFNHIHCGAVGKRRFVEACGLHTDIKWPNDLLAGERKICGILAEVIEPPTGRGIVLGIGINLTREAFPPELMSTATSVAEATGRPPEREAVLSALVNALSRWYVLLHESDGPEKVLADWTSRSSYALESGERGERRRDGFRYNSRPEG